MSTPGRPPRRALVRWQRAAGPYWPFVCAAPFLAEMPVRYSARPLAVAGDDSLPALLGRLTPDARPSLFLDIAPVDGLALAPVLNRSGLVTVPVIQRWPVEPAVLPCRRLLARLLQAGEQVRYPAEPRGVAFLLDGERTEPGLRLLPGGERRSPVRGRRFDNRYSYRTDRFPPPAFLLRQGITVVRWVSRLGIASDLLPYARQLDQAGLEIEASAWEACAP